MQRCPTHDELRSFAGGRLAQAAAEAISRHLGECPACLRALEEIDAEADPLVCELRNSLHSRPLSRDECSRAVRRASAASESISTANAELAHDLPLDRPSSSATAQPNPTGPSVRCPQCHTRFDLPGSASEQLSCPECGERFALAAEPRLEEVGTGSLDHFQIIERLGQGSFGTVWKAWDTQLNRLVAVKVSRRGESDRFEPLLREARTAAQVKHSHIVDVHEVGRQGGLFYIVSDYVDGQDLDAWLAGQPLPPREAAEIACTLAEALEAAHRSGVVHRDLKPGNILMDRSGRPHITDFGLAKHELSGLTITMDGHLLGTPAYMSPEQARGEGVAVDARSDVYSLGVVFYEMLCGRAPFQGDLQRVVSQILLDEPPPMARFAGRPPRDLETIARKCLEKQPERRYQSSQELADDLRRYLDGRPIKARPVGWVGSVWRWCKRRPATAALLALLAAVTVGAAAALSTAHVQTAAALSTIQEQSYFEQISTASRKWLANDPAGGLAVLESCPADMRRFEWSYLHRLLSCPEMKIRDVNVFAFSPDGKEICTDISTRPGLGFFDVDRDELIRFSLTGQAWTRSLDWSADGRMLLTDNLKDGLICLRSANDGQLIRTFPGHRRTIVEAQFHADGRRVVSWGRDNAIHVWETATAKPVTSIEFRNRRVRWIAVSPVEDRIAVASGRGENSSLTIWDSTTGGKVEEIPTGGRVTTGLAYSPDGRTLAVAEPRGPIRFWQLNPPRLGLVIAGPVSDYPRPVFNPEGRQIAAETPDGTIRMWDTADGREVRELRGNKAPAICLKFSPDGRRLAASGADHVLHVWDANSEQGTATLDGGTTPVVDLQFGPQGDSLAAVFKDGMLGVWSVSSATRQWILPAEQGRAYVVDWTQDGRRLAVAGNDGAVRIVDASSGEPVLCFKEHEKSVRAVDFSPDGARVASAGMGGQVHVWEAATGKVVRSFALESPEIRSVAFHPAGDRLAAGTRDWKIAVWDLGSGKIVWQSSERHHPVWDVAWSPDGKRLAVSYADGRVLLHDTAAGKHGPVMGIAAQEFPVQVAFSPDGARLAIAAAQTGLTFWEAPSGRHVLDLRREPTVTGAVAFDPSGRMIAGGQTDGRIALWLATPPETSQAAKGKTD